MSNDLPLVKLVDSTFSGEPSMSSADETSGREPSYFRWDRTPGDAEIKVFTDVRLREARDDPAPKKIALLIEPRGFSPGPYQFVEEHYDQFWIIFTHDRKLLGKGSRSFFYPFGGTRFTDWDIKKKSKLCSIIVGPKEVTEGHKLRHRVAKQYTGQIDIFGRPYTGWMKTKHPALDDYMFSVVIENTREDYWFTEKLIDCLAVGTIPIYWGCPSLSRFLDTRGIISFREWAELDWIFRAINFDLYWTMRDRVSANHHFAADYQIAEDWLYHRYHYTGAFGNV